MSDKRKKNTLIIGEAPDEDEATELIAGGEEPNPEATEIMTRRPTPRPRSKRKPPPPKAPPRKRALLVKTDPGALANEDPDDDTAPIPRRLSQLAIDSAQAQSVVAERPVVLRGTVQPGRTNAFQLGEPVRRLDQVHHHDPDELESTEAPSGAEPRVMRGTVRPGKTSSFFLGEEGPAPAAPTTGSCWRLHVWAPEDAIVIIDGVECGRGPVTIEGEAPGLELVVEVERDDGAGWAAQQTIEARVDYELQPVFDLD